MNQKRKDLTKGIFLMVSFVVVLVLMFLPLNNGHNILESLDNLYNTISKGSANYLPKVRAELEQFASSTIEVELTLADAEQSEQTARLFAAGGVQAQVADNRLRLRGDLVGALTNAVDDAEVMYHNQGEGVRTKYGYDERRALYNWWTALKALDFELSRQRLFKEAKLVATVQNRAVETAYNYYGIEAQSVRDRYGIIFASLLFYVVYTLWYGFGVLYIFEGIGLKLGH